MIALVACGAAQASDKNGHFQLLAWGTVPCATYLGTSKNDRVYAQMWWAGYVSALNSRTANVWSAVGVSASARIDPAIEAECTANPKELFGVAVENVVQQQLDKNKIAVSPP